MALALEQSAADLRTILAAVGLTPVGRSAIADVRALEVAFVCLRRGDGSLDAVRAPEARLAAQLRLGGRPGEAAQLDTWFGCLRIVASPPSRPGTSGSTSPPTPTPTPTPSRPTTPPTPTSPTRPTPPTPTPPTPTARDLLLLPPTLPSKAVLSAFAGSWQVVLIGGGEGAMSPTGEPAEFVGNLVGPALEQFFADLSTAGITTPCLVLDFEFSLAWLDRVLPLLAPGGVVLAAWSSARGQLTQTLLGGTRAPIDVLAGATALLRSRYPEEWFDSPHALLSGGTLLRGASAIDWVLLDPKLANSNLAASHAVIDWVGARMLGEGRPIRRCEVAWGLDGFVARARALTS